MIVRVEVMTFPEKIRILPRKNIALPINSLASKLYVKERFRVKGLGLRITAVSPMKPKEIWGFTKIEGTLLGVPENRTMVFLIWCPRISGNYQTKRARSRGPRKCHEPTAKSNASTGATKLADSPGFLGKQP